MYKTAFQENHNISISDEVNCPVCLEMYTVSTIRNPVMLPSCGHTLCRDCINSICLADGEHICPICRVPFQGMLPSQMPPNYAVMSLLEKLNFRDIKTAIAAPPQPSAPPLIIPENTEELSPIASFPSAPPDDPKEPKLIEVTGYHGPLPNPEPTEDKLCIKCGEKMLPWSLQSTCFSCADFSVHTSASNIDTSTDVEITDVQVCPESDL